MGKWTVKLCEVQWSSRQKTWSRSGQFWCLHASRYRSERSIFLWVCWHWGSIWVSHAADVSARGQSAPVFHWHIYIYRIEIASQPLWDKVGHQRPLVALFHTAVHCACGHQEGDVMAATGVWCLLDVLSLTLLMHGGGKSAWRGGTCNCVLRVSLCLSEGEARKLSAQAEGQINLAH